MVDRRVTGPSPYNMCSGTSFLLLFTKLSCRVVDEQPRFLSAKLRLGLLALVPAGLGPELSMVNTSNPKQKYRRVHLDYSFLCAAQFDPGATRTPEIRAHETALVGKYRTGLRGTKAENVKTLCQCCLTHEPLKPPR